MKPDCLTFNRLESCGRLGNQAFQVASTVGIAHTIGARPCLPAGWSYRPYFNCPDEWFRPVRGRSMESYSWEGLGYMDERARLYLQDPSLFRDVADGISAAFKPSERAAAEHLGWNLEWDDAIAVHVRRGDLLTQDQGYQPALTVDAPDYYRDALNKIDPSGERHVVAFSDDPEWVRMNDVATFGREVQVWVGEPRSHRPREYRRQEPRDWIDLLLMAHFSRLVMSNSTYAFWAAWLGRPKTVLYPSLWWGWRLDYLDHHLMTQPGWVEVDCG